MDLLAKFNRFYRRFKAAQRGTTAIIFGIMVIPLIAITGGAVDYGRAVKTKAQLSTALDGAILAAMKEYSVDKTTDYQKVIEDFITKNLSEVDKTYQGLELTVSVSEIGEDGEMKASVATDVSTNFLKLVGFDEFNVNVGAAAVVGGKDLEVVLVLDNTGSMGGSKIIALRDSATDLVDMLMTGDGDRVKFALVPFAEYVNVGIDKRDEDGLEIPDDYSKSGTDYKWYGCMGSRANKLAVKDEDYDTKVPGMMMVSSGSSPAASWRCPSAPIIDLTSTKVSITNGIDDMTASGWTYIPGGLAWGWRVLSNEAPFTTGVPYDDDEITKVIVLMTDGENTRATKKWNNDATIYHVGKVRGHSVTTGGGASAKADKITKKLCKNIKKKDIIIFTIAFEVDEGSPVETLMRNCAGNGGQYFDADNDAELEEAFREIGLSLLNLRLSQ